VALLTAALLAVALLAVALLTPGSLEPGTAPAEAAGPHLNVVAAENFWGNIAEQIGGATVHVTSLITNPNADPHLFETNATDAAALANAQVVVENGAGYDTWMQSLLAAGGGHPRVVDAATVLGVRGRDPNPHLWYDVPRVPEVAAAVARALSAESPGQASVFRSNLAAFDASLGPDDAIIRSIATQHPRAPVAYTERVPGYLLADAHLSVVTPAGFARSVEDGTEPSIADTVALQNLLGEHRVAVLLYNVQTVTPVTTRIRSMARQDGVPTVGVSETMPTRFSTYQGWQRAQVVALERALAR
jgi:zinc/manganese transport system substrate-binding protein